jgi:hypothetical protein
MPDRSPAIISVLQYFQQVGGSVGREGSEGSWEAVRGVGGE